MAHWICAFPEFVALASADSGLSASRPWRLAAQLGSDKAIILRLCYQNAIMPFLIFPKGSIGPK